MAESRDMGRLLAMKPADRPVVFYAEDTFTFVQYEGYLTTLLARGVPVMYVTSAVDDPLRVGAPPGMEVFYVDRQLPRLFERLDSAVVALTMPDLGRFQIPVPPAHTVYVFHSLNSVHTAYRTGAFDHYDTFLCTGPHHVEELRVMRAQRGLSEARLLEVGYYKLDRIAAAHDQYVKQDTSETTVLVAPSWGPDNLLEAHGEKLIASLRGEGFKVIVRPHPQFFHSLYPMGAEVVDRLEGRFLNDEGVVFERSIDTEDSFHEADLMVSDWSGAAYEYALGTLRPVLFVDTPQKIFNNEWEALGLPSFERTMRDEVGMVVPSEEAAGVGEAASLLIKDPVRRKDELDGMRANVVFNSGRAGAAGSDAISRLIKFP